MKRKNKIRLFWGSMILVFALLISSQIGNASTERKFITVTVHSGDTLWSLAQEHGDSTKDVRRNIDEIKELNQLNGSAILVGQTLRIPQ